MIFTQKLKITTGIFLTLGLFNLFAILHLQGLMMVQVFNMLVLCLLPGAVILETIGIKDKGPAWYVLNSLGLSVLVNIVVGLICNMVLSAHGVGQPLGALNYIQFLDIFLLLCTAIYIIVRKDSEHRLDLSVIAQGWYMSLGVILLPILAVMGATLQNNGGSNIVTLGYILSTAAFIVMLFINRRRLPEGGIVWQIFIIGLSLLLMTSMRSWHISGYDINQEYQVFQLTKVPLQWAMSHLQDPYNACLSITILPTIISQFVPINDEYIYKFAFQFIFAALPAVLYLSFRHAWSRSHSLLAVFLFISQAWFFGGMPTLIRQEIALLFFALLLLTIFDRGMKDGRKYILVMLYSAGMIFSHYSTTYIAISLFSIAYGLNLLIMRYKWFRPKWVLDGQVHPVRQIKFEYILFLLLGTLLWNQVITNTSQGFVKFMGESTSNISSIFTDNTIGNAINQLIYAYPSKINIQNYVQTQTTQFRHARPDLHFYPDAAYNKFGLQLVSFQSSPAYFGSAVKSIVGLIFIVIKISINNIFIILGTFVSFVAWRKGRFREGEYVLVAFGAFIYLGLLLILPGALQGYNIERLYLQYLIIWAPLTIAGGLTLLSFLRRQYARNYVLLSIIIIQLFFYSGLIYSFAGGPALLPVASYGEDYEKFYAHESEVLGAKWLSSMHGNDTVFTNSPGRNKLWAYGNVGISKIVTDTLPSVIDRNSYVYLTYLNTVGGKAIFSYNQDEYAYRFPSEFLDNSKDEIYSSGSSRVYK